MYVVFNHKDKEPLQSNDYNAILISMGLPDFVNIDIERYGYVVYCGTIVINMDNFDYFYKLHSSIEDSESIISLAVLYIDVYKRKTKILNILTEEDVRSIPNR